MRTRTRVLAVSALVAATARLAPAQQPAADTIVAAPAAGAPGQAPAALPPTLSVQPAPPRAAPTPEAAPPAAPAPGPITPRIDQTIPPIALPSGATGCATCGSPEDPAAPAAVPGIGDHKGPREATWIQAGYMMSWFKPAPVPFAAATGSANGTGPVLLGDNTIGYGMFSGIRAEGGTWTNDAHTFGIGLGGFLTEERSQGQATGGPLLSRPFFNVLSGGRDALIVAAPGVTAPGTVAVGTSARFAGAEANLFKNLAECDRYTVNMFVGFRYLDLSESLTVTQMTTPTGSVGVAGKTVPAGQTITLLDQFRTRNQFYGGQLGGQFEARRGIFFASFNPRVGFGPNHESVMTDGTTTAGGQSSPGGLLAVGTTGTPAGRTGNDGRDVTNYFTVMTELGSQLGLQVTKGMRLAVGYNFLYLNNVARPGSQVDTTVNPRLVPVSAAYGTLSGPHAPNQTFSREDFWAHGVSFMLQVQY